MSPAQLFGRSVATTLRFKHPLPSRVRHAHVFVEIADADGSSTWAVPAHVFTSRRLTIDGEFDPRTVDALLVPQPGTTASRTRIAGHTWQKWDGTVCTHWHDIEPVLEVGGSYLPDSDINER